VRILFDIAGLLLILVSIGSCVVTKGAVQEIGSMVLAVIGAIFLVGAALLRAVEDIAKTLKKDTPPTPPEPDGMA
jgi:uncharacterized membrane protein